jgi:hypothetical protein
MKPAIGVTGPPDPGFAKQLGAPMFMGVVMGHGRSFAD